MDFLRLSRSRSGSSGNNNKKRSPLPSPNGRRLSDYNNSNNEATTTAVFPTYSSSSSTAAQHNPRPDQRATTTSLTSANAMKIPIEFRVSSANTNDDKQGRRLSSGGDSAANLQVIEFSFPSLLSPPNPAFVSGSDARGILINARRPSLATSDSDREMVVSTFRSASVPAATTFLGPSTNKRKSATSGLLSVSQPQARPQLRNSASVDSLGVAINNTAATPSTSIATASAGSSSEPLSSSVGTTTTSRGRIRFAPLPDPRRPRSHSTGRDIWFDDDSENHVHINVRNGITQVSPDTWAGGPSTSSSNTSDVDRNEHTDTISGVSPGKLSSLSHRRTSSTLSKFLQPLKLGRSKSRESDKANNNSPDADSFSHSHSHSLSLSTSPSTSLSQWLNGGESLARSISGGAGASESERKRKEEFKSSGVPLKKSNTQESQQAPSQPTRRILYPSVAQGGVRRRDRQQQQQQASKQAAEEPVFIEWSNPSAVKSRAAMNGNKNDEDEDDGSGMAWLKKRRAEREKKAKEEAEAVAVVTTAPASTQQAANAAVAKEEESETTADSMEMPPIESIHSDTSEQIDTPSLETSELGIEEVDSSSESETSAEKAGEDSQDGGMNANNKEAVLDEGDDASGDGETGSESGDDESSDSEDGNIEELTAAEVEEEDRLAEEARRTTGGASRELYHTHEHQGPTYTFEVPNNKRKTPSRAGSCLTLPERKGSLPSSLTSEMIPRVVSQSHPGDWGLKEQTVSPC